MNDKLDGLEVSLQIIRKRFLDRVEVWLKTASDFKLKITENSWTDAQLDEVYMQLHKIAGSAQTFGFPELSDCARTAELAVERLSWGKLNAGERCFLEIESFIVVATSVIVSSRNNVADVVRNIELSEPSLTVSTEKLSVFLVDDDDLLRDLLTRSLLNDGVQTWVESDGNAAMLRLKEFSSGLPRNRPDVIILDVHMPGVNGLEILKYIKNDERIKDIPVLIVTRDTSESIIMEGISHGAVDYISKPFDIRCLQAKIQEIARAHRTKILIADSDTFLSRAMSRRFQQAGFSTQEVQDGGRILDAILDYKPNVIILEASLPGLDGISILHKMKSGKDIKDIPVIMMSSNYDSETVLQSFQFGAQDFILKPIDLEEVVARSKGIARRQRLQDYLE
ncbi:hypothetical protein BFP70_09895 [Thioclava sp. SK-1]|uniref:response regulator n=1 Tax=Thioclava sp. SK-1 TaxID=1889770 RepID=UPI000826C452|nr:response regulator [Thioclava sp. SK-1]OCX65366.1 hypothetical protein BFP70_09895 [Thioclava sp. SK-1]